jgi:hypothetical protein
MSDEDISQPLWDPRLDPTEESLWGPVRKWGHRAATDWSSPCPNCGYLLDTPNHEFGCAAVQGRVEFPLPEYRAAEHGRDELAALIQGGYNSVGSPTLEQIWRDKAYQVADAIIADGWRKP